MLLRQNTAETVVFGYQCPGHEIFGATILYKNFFLFPADGGKSSQFIYKLNFVRKGETVSSPVETCCPVGADVEVKH